MYQKPLPRKGSRENPNAAIPTVSHLVLMLTKSKDGGWQVKDIDMRDKPKVEPRVQLYLGGRYDTKPEKK